MESATQLHRENGTFEADPARSGTTPSRLVAEVTDLRAEVERLQGAIRTRDQRAAFVVHELRQPLSLLILIASSLARRKSGAERDELERLCAAGLRLDSLVSDLNDASFLESGQFTLDVTPTDLVGLTRETLGQHMPQAQFLVQGEIPPVDLDRRRVEQILTNLLANAQKYGNARTTPRVEIARSGEVVVVSVTNEGSGIADDERTKVFEPYYRGRGRAPGTRGLGLGLYICRRLVEEHGGTIWTDGDALHTRVSFSLPVTDPAARASGMRFVVAEGE